MLRLERNFRAQQSRLHTVLLASNTGHDAVGANNNNRSYYFKDLFIVKIAIINVFRTIETNGSL